MEGWKKRWIVAATATEQVESHEGAKMGAGRGGQLHIGAADQR